MEENYVHYIKNKLEIQHFSQLITSKQTKNSFVKNNKSNYFNQKELEGNRQRKNKTSTTNSKNSKHFCNLNKGYQQCMCKELKKSNNQLHSLKNDLTRLAEELFSFLKNKYFQKQGFINLFPLKLEEIEKSKKTIKKIFKHPSCFVNSEKEAKMLFSSLSLILKVLIVLSFSLLSYLLKFHLNLTFLDSLQFAFLMSLLFLYLRLKSLKNKNNKIQAFHAEIHSKSTQLQRLALSPESSSQYSCSYLSVFTEVAICFALFLLILLSFEILLVLYLFFRNKQAENIISILRLIYLKILLSSVLLLFMNPSLIGKIVDFELLQSESAKKTQNKSAEINSSNHEVANISNTTWLLTSSNASAQSAVTVEKSKKNKQKQKKVVFLLSNFQSISFFLTTLEILVLAFLSQGQLKFTALEHLLNFFLNLTVHLINTACSGSSNTRIPSLPCSQYPSSVSSSIQGKSFESPKDQVITTDLNELFCTQGTINADKSTLIAECLKNNASNINPMQLAFINFNFGIIACQKEINKKSLLESRKIASFKINKIICNGKYLLNSVKSINSNKEKKTINKDKYQFKINESSEKEVLGSSNIINTVIRSKHKESSNNIITASKKVLFPANMSFNATANKDLFLNSSQPAKCFFSNFCESKVNPMDIYERRGLMAFLPILTKNLNMLFGRTVEIGMGVFLTEKGQIGTHQKCLGDPRMDENAVETEYQGMSLKNRQPIPTADDCYTEVAEITNLSKRDREASKSKYKKTLLYVNNYLGELLSFGVNHNNNNLAKESTLIKHPKGIINQQRRENIIDSSEIEKPDEKQKQINNNPQRSIKPIISQFDYEKHSNIINNEDYFESFNSLLSEFKLDTDLQSNSYLINTIKSEFKDNNFFLTTENDHRKNDFEEREFQGEEIKQNNSENTSKTTRMKEFNKLGKNEFSAVERNAVVPFSENTSACNSKLLHPTLQQGNNSTSNQTNELPNTNIIVNKSTFSTVTKVNLGTADKQDLSLLELIDFLISKAFTETSNDTVTHYRNKYEPTEKKVKCEGIVRVSESSQDKITIITTFAEEQTTEHKQEETGKNCNNQDNESNYENVKNTSCILEKPNNNTRQPEKSKRFCRLHTCHSLISNGNRSHAKTKIKVSEFYLDERFLIAEHSVNAEWKHSASASTKSHNYFPMRILLDSDHNSHGFYNQMKKQTINNKLICCEKTYSSLKEQFEAKSALRKDSSKESESLLLQNNYTNNNSKSRGKFDKYNKDNNKEKDLTKSFLFKKQNNKGNHHNLSLEIQYDHTITTPRKPPISLETEQFEAAAVNKSFFGLGRSDYNQKDIKPVSPKIGEALSHPKNEGEESKEIPGKRGCVSPLEESLYSKLIFKFKDEYFRIILIDSSSNCIEQELADNTRENQEAREPLEGKYCNNSYHYNESFNEKTNQPQQKRIKGNFLNYSNVNFIPVKNSFADFKSTSHHSKQRKITTFQSNSNDQRMFSLLFLNVTALVKANLDSERVFMEKQRKLAYIAHEFKTPLNAIIMLSNTVINKIDTKESITEDVQNIESLSNYSSFLIADFIQASKSQEQIQIVKTKVNLRKILEFCRNIMKTLLGYYYEKKNVKSELIVDDCLEDFLVETDEIRLKQVLLNFISNSVKFTKKGKIQLICSVVKGRAECSRKGSSINLLANNTNKEVNNEERFSPNRKITSSNVVSTNINSNNTSGKTGLSALGNNQQTPQFLNLRYRQTNPDNIPTLRSCSSKMLCLSCELEYNDDNFGDDDFQSFLQNPKGEFNQQSNLKVSEHKGKDTVMIESRTSRVPFANSSDYRDSISNSNMVALKHSYETIVVPTSPNHEQISYPYIKLIIKDTGSGMNNTQLKELLANNTTPLTVDRTNNATGTGLGLNLSRKFIDRMGYSYKVHSKVNAGTETTLYISNGVKPDEEGLAAKTRSTNIINALTKQKQQRQTLKTKPSISITKVPTEENSTLKQRNFILIKSPLHVKHSNEKYLDVVNIKSCVGGRLKSCLQSRNKNRRLGFSKSKFKTLNHSKGKLLLVYSPRENNCCLSTFSKQNRSGIAKASIKQEPNKKRSSSYKEFSLIKSTFINSSNMFFNHTKSINEIENEKTTSNQYFNFCDSRNSGSRSASSLYKTNIEKKPIDQLLLKSEEQVIGSKPSLSKRHSRKNCKSKTIIASFRIGKINSTSDEVNKKRSKKARSSLGLRFVKVLINHPHLIFDKQSLTKNKNNSQSLLHWISSSSLNSRKSKSTLVQVLGCHCEQKKSGYYKHAKNNDNNSNNNGNDCFINTNDNMQSPRNNAAVMVKGTLNTKSASRFKRKTSKKKSYSPRKANRPILKKDSYLYNKQVFYGTCSLQKDKFADSFKSTSNQINTNMSSSNILFQPNSKVASRESGFTIEGNRKSKETSTGEVIRKERDTKRKRNQMSQFKSNFGFYSSCSSNISVENISNKKENTANFFRQFTSKDFKTLIITMNPKFIIK